MSCLSVSVSVCFTAILSMAAQLKRTVGRPRLRGTAKYIRLRESVFNLWREKKEILGYGNFTDSMFAEILLHRRWAYVTLLPAFLNGWWLLFWRMKPAVVHFLCSKVSNYHLYSTEKLGMWRNFTICLLPISELVRMHMRNARPRDIELLLCAGTM